MIKNPYDTYNSLYSVSMNQSLQEMLEEIAHIFDNVHLFAYRNWGLGAICKGPEVTRHWIKFSLEYCRDEMPDPEGARRLANMNIRVSHEMAIVEMPVDVETIDDIDPDTGEARTEKVAMCYVHFEVPRQFVDDIAPSTDSLVIMPDGPADSEAEEEDVEEEMDGLEDEEMPRGGGLEMEAPHGTDEI